MVLHDSSIAHIAKLIQMAILTGTDIVDHLRMAQFNLSEDDKITVNKEYSEVFEEQIKKMLENQVLQSQTQDELSGD